MTTTKPLQEMYCSPELLLPDVNDVFTERILLIFLKRPSRLEMVVINELVDRMMHVPVIRAFQIRGVFEIKRERLGLRRIRSAHCRLVAGHAVMREFNLAAIDVVHGDHLHGLALLHHAEFFEQRRASRGDDHHVDRKSTRLNSSHTVISYAVFCLKNKIRWSLPILWPLDPHQP